MIGSPDLFRSWKDVGADGLTNVERIARSEFPDGDRILLRQVAATHVAREPTLLRRFASALHLVHAQGNVPAAARAAGIHPGIAAVHFARGSQARTDLRLHPVAASFVLAACPEDCEGPRVEREES